MRERIRSPHSSGIYRFCLDCGRDASALSRFAHQVLDSGLCDAAAVVVEVPEGCAGDTGCLGLLDLLLGRLATRRVFTVVLSPRAAGLEAKGRRTYPQFATARFATSEGEVALLLLDHTHRPQ